LQHKLPCNVMPSTMAECKNIPYAKNKWKKKMFNGEKKTCDDHYNDHNDNTAVTKKQFATLFHHCNDAQCFTTHKTWWKTRKIAYLNTTLSIMMITQTFYNINFDNVAKSKNHKVARRKVSQKNNLLKDWIPLKNDLMFIWELWQ